MATLRTVTVKPSGGDYSSAFAAEAGEQANLVSLDRQLDIECYSMNDLSGGGADGLTFDGWTTDATRYIRLYAPSAERHDGKWHTGKYILRNTGDYRACLRINEEFVRVVGIQIHQNQSANHVQAVWVSPGAASGVLIDSCIVKGATGSGSAGAGVYHGGYTLTVRNTVIYGNATTGIYSEYAVGAPVLTVENCTVIGGSGYGIQTDSSQTVRNTYCHGTTDAYSGAQTRTTCAHSSATSFTGSTASVAHSTANFTNVTATTEDYHLVSGSALINAGTDLSGTFTTDIDGATRTGTWDIGADEFAGAATKAPPAFRRPARWFKRGA